MIYKLMNINRFVMYLLLVIAIGLPLLFLKIEVPTITASNTEDLYIAYNKLPEGSTVFLESDWTVSTRGENAGQLEALLKLLRLRNVKFVLYSCSDAQAPQVARNTITNVNKQLVAAGLEPFKPWEDYVDVGFYPDIEALYNAIKSNPRNAFTGKTANNPATRQMEDVYKSPVLKDIRKVEDIAMVINISASGTLKYIVQRIGSKTKIGSMVTGVMGPEAMNYYAAKQIAGLSVGLRGVVELETMMAKGVNYSDGDKEPLVKAEQLNGKIDPIDPKLEPFGRGMRYFASLHAALFLLILAVVLGNIGLYLQKRQNKGAN